ncbi:hypothetical protein MNV49_003444 [Pseudohyphozyma bogoriensis]|nr:hypothetical protein MNV49_003444 [Pseudohyphozyma bogoriensis]
MPASDPDALQADLAQRLAKLRSPPKPKPPPATESDVEAILASLDPPEDGDEEWVPVELKNVSDDEVARYLSEAASSVPSTLPSSTSSLPPPSNDRNLNAALESYEALAPAFASPIEVSFMNPNSNPGGVGSRTEEEDEALMARLRDELRVEDEQRGEEEGEMSALEKRLIGLKGFRVKEGSKGMVGGEGRKEEGAGGLGAPPKEVGMSDFELAASGSEDEEEDEDTEESEESEEEEDESDA